MKWAKRDLAGWGRYPVIEALCARPERIADVHEALAGRAGDPIVPHGLGRSYGDAALIRSGRAILTRRLNRMLDFDPATGWLRVEAGVSIHDLVKTFSTRGWFPPVVPGTQYVTVGGALACDIHGKNHHVDGCWSDHVRRVELLTGSGEVVICDRDNEPELFAATAGGLGLTGMILAMDVRLYPIQSPYIEMESIRVDNLDHFFEVSADSGDFTHTVTWVDCVATGKAMGRGVLMRGRHAPAHADPGAAPLGALADLLSPVLDLEHLSSNLLLNNTTVSLFNEVYFRKTPPGLTCSTVGIKPFFFPLDVVENWNRVYGSRGFLQYQFVVPHEKNHTTIRRILEAISQAKMASFLSVIKEFGDRDNGGLSFPKAGVTLALDIPNYGEPLFALLDRLDDMVVEAGGRIYLGKDARVSRPRFRRMYPDWQEWKATRDAWDPDQVFQSELGRRLGLVGES